MEFIESPAFTKYYREYIIDEELWKLQKFLLVNPLAGDIIQGTGGIRKLRWVDKKRGKGKRGGLRIIYYYFSEDGQIWLLSIYDKDEALDLTKEQRKTLKTAIEKEKKLRKNNG